MLDRFTYRQRFFTLIGGTVLVLLMAYTFAFSKTLEVHKERDALQQQLNNVSQAGNQVLPLTLQLEQLESLIGGSKLDDAELRRVLLEEVESYCSANKLKLVEVEALHQVEEGPYQVSSHILKVEGNFANLLGLTAYLENDFKQARLVSQQFKMERERRSRKEKLYGTYYIQVFKRA